MTQHLGVLPEEFVLEPYFSQEIALQERDVFLLCSDGLTDMVMDDEIARILESAAERGRRCGEARGGCPGAWRQG